MLTPIEILEKALKDDSDPDVVAALRAVQEQIASVGNWLQYTKASAFPVCSGGNRPCYGDIKVAS